MKVSCFFVRYMIRVTIILQSDKETLLILKSTPAVEYKSIQYTVVLGRYCNLYHFSEDYCNDISHGRRDIVLVIIIQGHILKRYLAVDIVIFSTLKVLTN